MSAASAAGPGRPQGARGGGESGGGTGGSTIHSARNCVSAVPCRSEKNGSIERRAGRARLTEARQHLPLSAPTRTCTFPPPCGPGPALDARLRFRVQRRQSAIPGHAGCAAERWRSVAAVHTGGPGEIVVTRWSIVPDDREGGGNSKTHAVRASAARAIAAVGSSAAGASLFGRQATLRGCDGYAHYPLAQWRNGQWADPMLAHAGAEAVRLVPFSSLLRLALLPNTAISMALAAVPGACDGSPVDPFADDSDQVELKIDS